MQINLNKASGFSLIEILVVVVIIGVTMGFALLAFGDFGEKRRILVSAEHFISYVTLVEQQAILESSQFRIQFDKNAYHVLRFQVPNHWQPMSEQSIFHTRHFSDDTVVHLETKVNKSNININATGQMTPFQLHLGSKKLENIATVVGQATGVLTLQVANSP